MTFAHRGQHRFGAQFLIASLVTAGARDAPLFGCGSRELQQLVERRSAGMVHGRTHRHLGSLQIETARLAALLEDDAQELIYFARDLLADRFRRFFSCGVEVVSSTGRKRQTCSLTSTNSRPSCW